MQFFGKFGKIICWCPPGGLASPPTALFRKLSLLAHPLGKPGYAPVNFSRFFFLTLPYLEDLLKIEVTFEAHIYIRQLNGSKTN